MKKYRVYVDTSVFGGVFDDEFQLASEEFFAEIKYGSLVLVTSAIVQEEIQYAPAKVQSFFNEFLEIAEIVDITEETMKLKDAYLNAGILTPKYSNDGLHVALASVSNCNIIVSWNFKHIVNFQKIPLYNAINILQGYNQIAIYSPLEVINYDE